MTEPPDWLAPALASSLLTSLLWVWAVQRRAHQRATHLSGRAAAFWTVAIPGSGVAMPTQDELVKAHDTLLALVLGELPDVSGREKAHLQAMLDVLCWTLGHRHNPAFGDMVKDIGETLKALGYVRVFVGDGDTLSDRSTTT